MLLKLDERWLPKERALAERSSSLVRFASVTLCQLPPPVPPDAPPLYVLKHLNDT